MEELKAIKNNKKSLKSSITKFKDKINNTIQNADISVLEVYEAKIITLLQETHSVFESLFAKCDEKDADEFIEEKETVIETLDELNIIVKRKMLNFNQEQKHAVSKNPFKDTVVSEVKLPKLSLPIFSGNIEEWIEFQDLFTASVHKNANLTNAQRLQYLKGSCKADALNIIHSIPISDANYDIAWNLLVERYSNKKDLINAIIKKLLSLPNTHEEASSLLKFVDNINESIRSLNVMEQKIEGFCDTFIVYILVNKLDRSTRVWYERQLKKDELGSIENLTSFLKEHSRTLLHKDSKFFSQKETKPRSHFSRTLTAVRENSDTCQFCKEIHSIHKCPQFINLPVKKRFEFVKKKNLCYNCLSSFHALKGCNSKNTCRKCHLSHNSLLHFDKAIFTPAISQARDNHASNLSPSARVYQPINSAVDSSQSCVYEDEQHLPSNTSLNISSSLKNVILSTIVVYIKNSENNFIPLKAIIDNGSQSNFLTYEALRLLNIKAQRINYSVNGLNNSKINIKECITTTICNSDKSFIRTLNFFGVPKITRIAPVNYSCVVPLKKMPGIILADPQFYEGGTIHVLLSNEIFFNLLREGQIHIQNLILQNTAFGYVVGGYTGSPQGVGSSLLCGHVTPIEDLSSTLKRFWEVEELTDIKKIKSKEEIYCEDHFLRTYSRNSEGRYIVEMPIKPQGLSSLGDSFNNASNRLNGLIKRFERNTHIKELYQNFISEYINLDHAEEISDDNDPTFSYYIPHHAIYKPEKVSTKLRVVFDASAATTSGISLNDILLNGGIVQDELFSIICRFRTYKYAFTADIVKMYRQILIKEDQQNLLRILWKCNEQPVKTYKLKTITYGTMSAPYLATRTLNQLAQDERGDFPLAADVVLRDFYVDDVLSGGQTLSQVKEVQSQLIALLEKGKLTLHKWCANDPALLQGLVEPGSYTFNSNQEENNIKTLGLTWNPAVDCFSFKVSIREHSRYTKRAILSDIARLYDPLGLVGPGITKAKIFMQHLWLQKLDWNETLPEKTVHDWKLFIHSMQSLNALKVPRFILTGNHIELELHGFSDASENAYGAVIYVRCTTSCAASTTLVCSKSRVAPLKTLTVPRLELQAAVLLSKLTSKVLTCLNLNITRVYLWTDSMIVLGWLKSSPHLLKTFIANRVVRVQQLTEGYHWNHIGTDLNPADLISRGVDFDKLINYKFWWTGPSFLNNPALDINKYLNKTVDLSTLEQCKDFVKELKGQQSDSVALISTNTNFINNIISLTNNYVKLLTIISFIFRFLNNCKRPHQKTIGPVSIHELNSAENYLLRETQRQEFGEEYRGLTQGKQALGKLKTLDAFLDDNNIVRVGGRLKNANIGFSQRHQVILPAKAKLTVLILESLHKKYLHIGPQALLNCVRQKFWPLRGRTLVRKITHACMTCRKAKPLALEQLMGCLPKERVCPSPPFTHVGTDQGGPFFVKYKGQRKGIFQKVYLAIFVCFMTKAVHLELVSDLTSDAYIATLKRFVARRGKCASISSDNAKNFVGANAILQKLQNLIKRPDERLSRYLLEEKIEWKFIPPRAPNFGGLWEAGIKSVKYHLKRTVGTSRLTFEELLTVITQIEAILNSRPITPLSADVNDFEALTPGHFLIGRPMTAIAEPDLSDMNENRLDRWQRTTRWVQLIWRRWSKEYLNTLQNRYKWQREHTNIKVGNLVLVKEDDLAINKWILGRIIKVIPGSDGKVRVLEILTATGVIKRAISKIAILPEI